MDSKLRLPQGYATVEFETPVRMKFLHCSALPTDLVGLELGLGLVGLGPRLGLGVG